MDDGRRRKTDKANANLEQLIDKELLRQKKDMWQFVCGCPARSRDVLKMFAASFYFFGRKSKKTFDFRVFFVLDG